MRVMNQYLLEGKGECSFGDPARHSGEEPELAQAPRSVYGGRDATRTNGSGDGGIVGNVRTPGRRLRPQPVGRKPARGQVYDAPP
jgi:hypothetical protein